MSGEPTAVEVKFFQTGCLEVMRRNRAIGRTTGIVMATETVLFLCDARAMLGPWFNSQSTRTASPQSASAPRNGSGRTARIMAWPNDGFPAASALHARASARWGNLIGGLRRGPRASTFPMTRLDWQPSVREREPLSAGSVGTATTANDIRVARHAFTARGLAHER